MFNPWPGATVLGMPWQDFSFSLTELIGTFSLLRVALDERTRQPQTTAWLAVLLYTVYGFTALTQDYLMTAGLAVLVILLWLYIATHRSFSDGGMPVVSDARFVKNKLRDGVRGHSCDLICYLRMAVGVEREGHK